MSRGREYWVFDCIGVCVGNCDCAKDAVELARRYAESSGAFADTVSRYGGKRKRFYADGRVQTIKRRPNERRA